MWGDKKVPVSSFGLYQQIAILYLNIYLQYGDLLIRSEGGN